MFSLKKFVTDISAPAIVICRKQSYLWAVGDSERAHEMAKRQLYTLDKLDKEKLLKMSEDGHVVSKIKSAMIIDTKGRGNDQHFVVCTNIDCD